MSTYWTLHCTQCDSTPAEFEINHGEEILQEIIRLRKHIAAIHEANAWYISVTVLHYGQPWDFLVEHKGHHLNIMSEYGEQQEVILVQQEIPEKGES